MLKKKKKTVTMCGLHSDPNPNKLFFKKMTFMTYENWKFEH